MERPKEKEVSDSEGAEANKKTMKVEEVSGRSFTVRKDTELVHGEVHRGTEVTRYLKVDQSEFLEERRLEDLRKEHSEFIGSPF